MKIAHITDLHVDEEFPNHYGVNPRQHLDQVLDDLRKRDIDSIIFGGDIGEPNSNKWFFDYLKTFELRITPGNHDDSDTVVQFFKPDQLASGLNWTEQLGPYSCIFMDSSKGVLDKEQMLWLSDQLNLLDQAVIFLHHPVLNIGASADKEYALKNQRDVRNLLVEKGIPITVFCGHYHMADETSDTNIRQFITPAISVQVIKDPDELKFDGSTFGYRIIELGKEIKSDLIMMV
ncbi:MAG: metallophosphoesterase family protein [Cyclobacteriaceae bacterium]